MACDCDIEVRDASQKKILLTLLLINGVMFISEIVVGIMADSTGVIADSLDMLADAMVYAIGLAAVGKAFSRKNDAARVSGYFQVGIAVLVMVDIVRRFVGGSEPVSSLMLIISCVALAANLLCLYLISKERNGEVHMRASWIFSKNDVLANLGVIIAGALIYFTGSRWPDLIIGSIITIVVLRGGIQILKEAKADKEARKAG
jgi:cation diffusion facilitator family transporter